MTSEVLSKGIVVALWSLSIIRTSAHKTRVVFVDLREVFGDDFLAVEAIRRCPNLNARDQDVMFLNIVGML